MSMAKTTEKQITGGNKPAHDIIGIPMSPAEMLKVNLAAFVSRVIQDKDITQAEAAIALGIDQPKVSKLLRGRLEEFSIERLMGFVLALGHQIDVNIGSDTKLKRRVNLAA
jgi:predicted XRE-type DNA-binding protein